MDGSTTISDPGSGQDSYDLPSRQAAPFRPLQDIDATLISLLELAAESICIMDDQSRILLFNKASESLFGYTSAEVIGKRVEILMPPKYADYHQGWVEHYLETGEAAIIGTGREVQGRHKDGTLFPFDLSVGVAETLDGKHFIGVMRDLSGRKQVEKRLRNLQTELNQMTRINAMDEMGATIAHELNQPLTAIILYLQTIERRLQVGDKDSFFTQGNIDQMLELCGRAIQEAQRSADLLQRIRSIIEKKEPERSICDLIEIIHQAHELALVGFSASDISLHLVAPDKVPLILADPVQIEQIFLNLLRNAFQAMRDCESKEIWVTLSLPEETDKDDEQRERLTIRFRDTGPGIPDTHRDTLFKAFGAERRNGMGLGLTIARSIAQNHGGSLDLAPKDDNQQGACFILTLPLATPDGTSHPADDKLPPNTWSRL